MDSLEFPLNLAANIAEIIAGFAIVFSVIKVWPVFTNLNRTRNKPQDWKQQLEAMRTSLNKLGPCRQLKNLDQAIDAILHASLISGSSDLHIEIKEFERELKGSIRFRTDGVLHEICRYDEGMHSEFVQAFKLRAGIELQATTASSGRFRVAIRPHGGSTASHVDFRIQFTPAVLGEVLVLRILDSAVLEVPTEVLGIEEANLTRLHSALNADNGLVVFSGPTGSGKTVALYSSLNDLDHEQKKIVTIEDPVEIELPAISQFSVVDQPGKRFPDMFRAAMSSDADVIMIGEIRDRQTARFCQRAASTGHLVLTTMHTNNAVETLEALSKNTDDLHDMDIFIMNQRLARRLCGDCSVGRTLTSEDGPLIEAICRFNQKDPDSLGQKFRSAAGCSRCQDGYKGRVGVYETLIASSDLLAAMDRSAPRRELWQLAIARGTTTYGFDVLQKAARGQTSLEEVRRLTAGFDYSP